MSLDLVRAPGTPTPTSTLSYPYTNELVNSFVEASLYNNISGEEAPSGADFDFRKQLYVTTSISRAIFTNEDVIETTLRHCAGSSKYAHRTALAWLQPGEFPKFSVSRFKGVSPPRIIIGITNHLTVSKEINRWRQRSIMRPYRPASPVHNKIQDQAETGLYVVGRETKSIFWYWEIHYELKVYREFKTMDLAEGKRVFREEFDLEVDQGSSGYGRYRKPSAYIRSVFRQ